MAIPEEVSCKNSLRSRMRRLLRGAPADSAAVLQTVEDWLHLNPHRTTIAVFSALPGEVDLSPLVSLYPQKRWVYPLIRGNDMTFHQVTDPATGLTSGFFGILEPSAELPPVPVREIEIFLCPGIAFDSRGGRLGRGRGYYDRLLAQARPSSLKIGVCFKFQRVPDTFPESHDVPMDLVLS